MEFISMRRVKSRLDNPSHPLPLHALLYLVITKLTPRVFLGSSSLSSRMSLTRDVWERLSSVDDDGCTMSLLDIPFVGSSR